MEEKMTAFQEWRKAGGTLRLPLFWRLRSNSRARLMSSRPYLEEGASGNSFRVSNFLALVGFIAVLGLWIMSAWPMVEGFLGFVTGPAVSAVVDEPPTVEGEEEQGSGAFFYQVHDAEPVSVATPTPTPTRADVRSTRTTAAAAPTCTVYVDLCTAEAIQYVQAASGCLAFCANP